MSTVDDNDDWKRFLRLPPMMIGWLKKSVFVVTVDDGDDGDEMSRFGTWRISLDWDSTCSDDDDDDGSVFFVHWEKKWRKLQVNFVKQTNKQK